MSPAGDCDKSSHGPIGWVYSPASKGEMFAGLSGSISTEDISCVPPSDVTVALRGNKFVAEQFPDAAFLEFVMEKQRAHGGKMMSVMNMVHTFVARSGRGRGLAGVVTLAAFRHCAKKKLQVRPSCSYIRKKFLVKHPEFEDICVSLEISNEVKHEVMIGG